ncbi:MAG: Xaa-Pro peptidase family protein [Candidatus Sumerlaeia bacterium]
MTSFPYEKRLAALQKRLKERGIAAAVILDRANTRYLSGFAGTYSYIVITQDEARFITDFRYWERAKAEVRNFEIVRQDRNAAATLRAVFETLAPRTIGFEEEISWAQVRFLKSCARRAKWIPISDSVRELRLIKDAAEVRAVARAAAIADKVFAQICTELRPGLSERQISRRLRDLLEQAGAEGESFPNIVAGGPHSAQPHAHPTDRRIRKGEILTLDFGAIVDGYCSDMTRTVFVGRPPAGSAKSAELKKIYGIVLEAQERALAAVAPGRTTIEVDAAARDVIRDAGYAECFGHGTGHGVGLEIHEPPRLAPGHESVLREGMIVTIEPGIYVAGTGGVRIEDLVLVTARGARRLSKAPKNLTVLS